MSSHGCWSAPSASPGARLLNPEQNEATLPLQLLGTRHPKAVHDLDSQSHRQFSVSDDQSEALFDSTTSAARSTEVEIASDIIPTGRPEAARASGVICDGLPLSHSMSRRSRSTCTQHSGGPSLAVLACTIILCVYFGVPSTFFLYLASTLVYLPLATLDIARRSCSGKPFVHRYTTPCMIALTIFAALLYSSSVFSFAVADRSPFGVGHTPARFRNDTSNEVTFVAVNLFDSEAILPRFTSSLLQFAQLLGHENVFISIYESNSIDQTKTLLQDFDKVLTTNGIGHSIVIGAHNCTEQQQQRDATTRIDRLAGFRNQALQGLKHPQLRQKLCRKGHVGQILWLNDIIFDASDAVTLLRTNGGDYDLACAMDFVPLGFYDTWVTRDMHGLRVKPMWPYFAHPADVNKIRSKQPLDVTSCWNGMAAFKALWFIGHITPDAGPTMGEPAPKPAQTSSSTELCKRPQTRPPFGPASGRAQPTSLLPLHFRASRTCVSSECLLIVYDMHQAASSRPRVLINPAIRVAYDAKTHFLYARLLENPISLPWTYIWQDWISHRLAGFVTDLGRKSDACAADLGTGWGG